VAAEVAERLPEALILQQNFGRTLLTYDGSPRDILALRTIEHVLAYVADLPPVRPEAEWLDELEAFMAETDLGPAVAQLRRLRAIPDPPPFRVTAERHGSHAFTSQQVGGFAGSGIIARQGWPVSLKQFAVEVRIEVREDRGWVGVQLSPTPLHRRSRIVHTRASINTTLAAAMVRLSEPTAGEWVCDPMCGAGTLLVEREAHQPGAHLLAGDMFMEKLALARQNFAAYEVPGALLQADAGNLPLRDGCLDKILCNLPWGRIIASPKINRRLYPKALAEIARCLRPGGLAVLLTSERGLMQNAVAQLPLTEEKRLHVHVGGLQPSLYVLRRG
jgi:tRNA (guanine6-N2)-methyltransferase